MRRSAASLLPALAFACTVGPGGSFPDSSGSAATVTVGSTAPSTTADTTDTAADSSSGTGTSGAPSTNDDDASSGGSTDASDSAPTSDPTDPSDPTGSGESGDTTTTDTGLDGTPLDPDLDIPDGNEQCDYPGDLNQCAGIATVCRFATVEYGLCESCDACGNLNAACTQGTDCDILFSCYAGRCTNFCTLGSFECGPAEDCLDVGHPTRGVCDPFA